MTNHTNHTDLADEIRRIPDTLATLSGDPAHRRGYVEDLAQRVQQLATPVEVDGSTELAANFGLEPEQEIRDRGLERALKACDGRGLGWDAADEHALLDLAEHLAGWIRTGERPA